MYSHDGEVLHDLLSQELTRLLDTDILANQKNFSAGHTSVFCGTTHKICGTCFAERKSTRKKPSLARPDVPGKGRARLQKAPAHVVSMCAYVPCKGTISFPDSSFLDVAFDCLHTYFFHSLWHIIIIRDRIALLRDCGTEVSFAGQSRGMRDGWQVCTDIDLSLSYLTIFS